MKYGIKNFIRIADSYVNSDSTSVSGLEKRLSAWFCFTFNTTLNDSRLLDMTVEELLVLYHMHEIRSNPNMLSDIDGSVDSYEEWLKKEMGDSYRSAEEMEAEMVKYEKEELEQVKDLPSTITTDFSAFESE